MFSQAGESLHNHSLFADTEVKSQLSQANLLFAHRWSASEESQQFPLRL